MKGSEERVQLSVFSGPNFHSEETATLTTSVIVRIHLLNEYLFPAIHIDARLYSYVISRTWNTPEKSNKLLYIANILHIASMTHHQLLRPAENVNITINFDQLFSDVTK